MLPRPKKCGTHYLAVLRGLEKNNLAARDLESQELRHYLDLAIPTTAIKQEERTFESTRAEAVVVEAYNTLMDENCQWEAKKGETPISSDFIGHWQGSLPLTIRGRAILLNRLMKDKYHDRDAGFDCCPGIISSNGIYQAASTFSRDQQAERSRIMRELDGNTDLLNALYKKQENLAKDKEEIKSNYPTFRAFLLELWVRFLFFHPFICLTVVYQRRSEFEKFEHEFIDRLYFNELRIINDWLCFGELITPVRYQVGQKKIQQFLRGITTVKFIRLKFGKKLEFSPGMLKAVGKFTWPYWDAKSLAGIAAQYTRSEISSRQAQIEIRELRKSSAQKNSDDLSGEIQP